TDRLGAPSTRRPAGEAQALAVGCVAGALALRRRALAENGVAEVSAGAVVGEDHSRLARHQAAQHRSPECPERATARGGTSQCPRQAIERMLAHSPPRNPFSGKLSPTQPRLLMPTVAAGNLASLGKAIYSEPAGYLSFAPVARAIYGR